jgi:hypothetical protein
MIAFTWTQVDDTHWSLTGTNTFSFPVHNTSIADVTAGRAFSFPTEMAEGDSHPFWTRVTATDPTSDLLLAYTWNPDERQIFQDTDGSLMFTTDVAEPAGTVVDPEPESQSAS